MDDLDAWYQYCNEFKDAHVYINWKPSEREKMKEYQDQLLGLDYGFCLVTKENGDTVFVNVDKDSEAYQKGVRDGNCILSIDGTLIEDAKKTESLAHSYWDQTTRKFVEGLYVTCDCGETMELTFKDQANQTVNAVIHGTGQFKERFHKTMDTLTHDNSEEKNYSYKILTKNIAVLTINTMNYSKAIQEEMRLKLKDTIAEIKSKGVTKLILDLRGNTGGYLDVTLDISSLFSDKEFLGFQGSSLGHDIYIDKEDYYVRAQNEWGDGDILILVDSYTVSAAELFVHTMKENPNVKTIGFTNSCGATGAVFVSPLKDFDLTFPVMVCQDELEQPIAETDATGKMTMPVDIQVPFDDEAYHALFKENTDYLLNYAVDVLNKKR